MVLHVGGGGNQPFTLKRKINNQPFSAIIDSGSSITIFTQADLRELLEVDVIFAERLPEKRTLLGLKQQATQSTRVYNSECKGGEKNNQKRPSRHHERWHTILDRTRLAQPTQPQSGRSEQEQ